MMTDPDTFDWPQRIRDGLARRFDAQARPSQWINQMHLAEVHCTQAINALRRLMRHAPSLRRWVHFAEPQALVVVPRELKVLTTRYWQGLAHGSALSREARWVQLHAEVFAHQAQLAHGLCALSDHGLAMALGLVDAPTLRSRLAAGGAWKRLQVGEVIWPTGVTDGVAFSGALHLYRDGAGVDKRQVIYLPGLVQPFHEFDSLSHLQQALGALINGDQGAALWQSLPLARRHILVRESGAFTFRRATLLVEDALRHSALAMLDTQRDNEWASIDGRHAPWLTAEPDQGCRMSPLQRLREAERGRRSAPGFLPLRLALAHLLEWDGERRAREITCAGLGAGLALRTREALVQRHEQGLLALLDPTDWGRDCQAYDGFVTLHERWLEQAMKVRTLLDAHALQLADKTFWVRTPEGESKHHAAQLLTAWRLALFLDARLQQRLGVISEVHLAVLKEVLVKPAPAEDDTRVTRVVQVSVGRSGQPLYRMLGVFVVTTLQALTRPDLAQPVLLQVPGAEGGWQVFKSLDELSNAIDASLKGADGSVLWGCIGRDERAQARTLVRSLGADEAVFVYFQMMGANLVVDSFQEQITRHSNIKRWVAQGGRPFSEVTDPGLTRSLLTGELADQLCVPSSAARAMALANVSLLRLASRQAKNLPAWLATAPRAARRHYRLLYIRYLINAQALEAHLIQVLPSLETFARDTLLARLAGEGLAGVDIDQPLLDMPDDVSTHWESHPQRPAADSGVRVVVSKERHTYSLLQLALHNLDDEAPWTLWRLNHSRYLDPAQKQMLPPQRLLQLIASLDLAGEYAQLIDQLFYAPASSTPGTTLFKALVARPLEQCARLELFSARQQGLSAAALSLFSTACAAKTPDDLHKNGHQVQLCCPHLGAFNLQQPRHIAGVLIIHDRASAKSLIYWPTIKGHPALSEYASLGAARQALISLAGAAANRPLLARHIAPGWEAQALASYPTPMRVESTYFNWRAGLKFLARQRWVPFIFKAPGRFLYLQDWFRRRREFPASQLAEIEQEINEQQELDPQQWLGISLTDGCDGLGMLAHAQVLSLHREVRAMANSTRELAGYRQWRQGEQSAARTRGLLSFIPGVSIGVNVYEVLLAARRFHHSGDPADGVGVGFSVLILLADVALTFLPLAKGAPKPRPNARPPVMRLIQRRQAGAMEGGNASLGLPVGASRLKGLEAFKKDVPADGAVALHGPVNQGTYIKAGEQFVRQDGHTYPVYRRNSERTLRLKSPQGDAQNELIVFIEHRREWLLGADAPEPRPGPSSGIRRPWEVQPAGTEWVAPSASHAERVARQPVLLKPDWQAWGRSLQGRTVQQISPLRRLYRFQGDEAFDAVKLGDDFYELLPNGSTVPDNIIFIKKPERPGVGPRHELTQWRLPDVREQPVPATFGSDQLWTPRVPLFTRPLIESVGDAFPGLTPASMRFVSERLVELADTGRSMTATRILNIRLTLDDWLPPVPNATGHTDDLLRMLRPLERTGRITLYINRHGVAPGMERVDFTLPMPLDPVVFRYPAVSQPRQLSAQMAVQQVLERQGFSVTRLNKSKSATLVNLVATHPKSNNLYYVMTRWAEWPSVSLKSRRFLQLSDAWLRSHDEGRYHSVFKAMDEGRLVRIIAGIQRDGVLNDGTVFFVKLAKF